MEGCEKLTVRQQSICLAAFVRVILNESLDMKTTVERHALTGPVKTALIEGGRLKQRQQPDRQFRGRRRCLSSVQTSN